MKALLILGAFVMLFLVFWMITTPITLLKVFIEALAGDSE